LALKRTRKKAGATVSPESNGRDTSVPARKSRPGGCAEHERRRHEHDESPDWHQSRRGKRDDPRRASPPGKLPSPMAAKQRDISVSEFFAKNRHLLGFDNPRKARAHHRQGSRRQLARCVRGGRASCRSMGPYRGHRRRPLQGRCSGQWPRNPQEADSAHFWQAAVWVEIPPLAAKPRAAGHRQSARPACTACRLRASR